LGISLFIFSPLAVEANRVNWVPYWYDVVTYVHDLPSSEIFLIVDPESGGNIRFRTYPVYGENFQHTVTVGTETKLFEKRIEDNPPEYIVKLCKHRIDCEDIKEKLNGELIPYGYEKVAVDTHAILLKHHG